MERNWIKKLLEERGRGSQAELARHLGVDPSVISKIVTGTRELKAKELFGIVNFFGHTKIREAGLSREIARAASDVVVDSSDLDGPTPAPGIPILGEVAAGQWIEPDDAIDSLRLQGEYVPPDPRFAARYQCAWIVRGRSVERFARDGQALVCAIVGDGSPVEPQDGDIVIAERHRAQGGLIERTAKRIRFFRDRTELVPQYDDESLNTPLVLSDRPDDEIEVRIIAVVLGVYQPLRRR